MTGKLWDKIARNRCKGRHAVDSGLVASPRELEPFHRCAGQWRSQQSAEFARPRPATTSIGGVCCPHTTIIRRIPASTVVFLSGNLHCLLDSSIFGVYIGLQPLLRHAAHPRDGCQRQPFQQQFINERFGFICNWPPSWIFDKLSPTRFTGVLGFAIMDMPISHYQT